MYYNVQLTFIHIYTSLLVFNVDSFVFCFLFFLFFLCVCTTFVGAEQDETNKDFGLCLK